MLTLLLSALPAGKPALALFFPLGGALPPGISELLPFLLIIVVFYFLLIRPNQNRQKKWQQMLGGLKSGDRITTNGGIRGTILSIKDDVVQIRVAPDNVRLEVVKTAIASVTTQDEAQK